MNAQIKALSLFQAGKCSDEIMEIISDEFPNISDEQIVKIVEDMSEVQREKDIELENINQQ